MYYTEVIQLNQAEPLLNLCDLSMPKGVDCTVGIFDDVDGSLVATGSIKGDMIQGMAVDPARQGEDLMAKVITALFAEARDSGSLYLFTKPEKSVQFTGLGFREIAKARPYAALLEWGENGVKRYAETLKKARVTMEKESPIIGGLVMNCNPFTNGHRYLVEQAAKQCDHVYILVVEENLSQFSFQHRLSMVQEGVKDLDHVTVLSGGRYAVSALTFPSYFTKDTKVADAHAAIDAEIFCAVIAPALGITKRFVGTEPLSEVTDIYNQTLKKRLPKHGIEVVEIPRLTEGDYPISASRVRALLNQGGKDAWKEIERIVPESTYRYLDAFHHQITLDELLEAREERAAHQQELLAMHGNLLLSITLNIPGPIKDQPAYRKALEEGIAAIEKRIGNDNLLMTEIRHKVTGSEGYLVVRESVFTLPQLKAATVEIEDASEAGRLLDIDVLTIGGSISRTDLQLPARKCFICGEDAKVCGRSRRHDMKELQAKVNQLLNVPES